MYDAKEKFPADVYIHQISANLEIQNKLYFTLSNLIEWPKYCNLIIRNEDNYENGIKNR